MCLGAAELHAKTGNVGDASGEFCWLSDSSAAKPVTAMDDELRLDVDDLDDDLLELRRTGAQSGDPSTLMLGC